jgi:sugar lactone lactonase YvrE
LVPTSTAVVGSTDVAVSGQAVTFTATVFPDPPFSGTPSGTVTFYVVGDKTPLGKRPLSGGTASLTAPLFGVGEGMITASYSGDMNFDASATGTITTVAGNGAPGYSGNNGPATSAKLQHPSGVAVDSAGELFIADSLNNVVREVDENGNIITVAGNGTKGYMGNNGPATSAQLNNPQGVAVDALGNLWIADTGNEVIREVFKANGEIITVAGFHWPFGLFSGDGGPATGANLNSPTGVAVDSSGDLFIADSGNNRIREVNTHGIINTVAGTGSGAIFGDNGPATSAELHQPTDVAVDSFGDLIIGDSLNNRIREVNTKGIITTVAGNGKTGYMGNNGPATGAELDLPSSPAGSLIPNGVVVDSSGDLFFADTYNYVVREVDLPGTITTVAGNHTKGSSGNNGPATSAQLSKPSGVALDSAGDLLFIADTLNNRIREVTVPATVVVYIDQTLLKPSAAKSAVHGQLVAFSAAVSAVAPGSGTPTGTVTFYDGTALLGTATLSFGTASLTAPLTSLGEQAITARYSGDANFAASVTGTITTVAGDGTEGYSGDGGPATSAELFWPHGVAVDASGDLFIADTTNGAIREVVKATGDIRTVASKLGSPQGVAVNAFGNVFIADTSNDVVREMDQATEQLVTVAGNGTAGYSGDGGPATSAELNNPNGVVLDKAGDLFIADANNNVVREVNTSGIITTVAGNGSPGYSGDGRPATSAELHSPRGLAVDGIGDLFIVDFANHRIREVVKATGVITTVAGNGTGGYSGNGGPATRAELLFPTGVVVDAVGDLFIADSGNSVIREVNTSGIITTVAGNGTHGYSGDNGPATTAKLYDAAGVALDNSGDLFIADTFNNRIRRVTLPAVVVVNRDATTTALVPSNTAVFAGQPITFTATVAVKSPGAGTPTGTVTFYDGKTALGTVKLDGSAQATLTTSQLAVGTHLITAKYNGDTDDYSSTSIGVGVPVVNPAIPTRSSSTAATDLGQAFPATATVSMTSPDAGLPNGWVTFPVEYGSAVVLPRDRLQPNGEWNDSLTIATSGEPAFRASPSAKVDLKKKSWQALARPMAVFLYSGRGWRVGKVQSVGVWSPIGELGQTSER